jgi:hypothetical protein
MGAYGKRTEAAYENLDAPEAYADNDHILVWWLPEYDDVLRKLVQEQGWAWPWETWSTLSHLIPANVLETWKRADPLCAQFAHYNVLMYFAIARAKRLGLIPRKPQWRTCPTCNQPFIESSLPAPILKRVGIDDIDCCSPCYETALLGRGSNTRSKQEVIDTIRTLGLALRRSPQPRDLQGPKRLADLDRDDRIAVMRALLTKPTGERVTALFGSWNDAVASAAGGWSKPTAPTDNQPGTPSATPASQRLPDYDWVSAWGRPDDWKALYLAKEDPHANLVTELRDINLLIGSGETRLAEQLLRRVCTRPLPFLTACAALADVLAAKGDQPGAISLLSQYIEYVRSTRPQDMEEQIQLVASAIDRIQNAVYPGGTRGKSLLDESRRTNDGTFWRPLPRPARGNVTFVFVGGQMHYVDLRGEHECASFAEIDGGGASQLSENVARLNILVDSASWVRTAVLTSHRLLGALQRGGIDDAWGYAVGYTSGWFRDCVKDVAGRLPVKATTAGLLDKPGRGRWLHDRDPLLFVLHCSRGYPAIDVRSTPTVAIWRWPDRSDLALQAFCDVLSSSGASPLAVVLPDIPALRDFARRYNRQDPMTNVMRTLIESQTLFAEAPGDRGDDCFGRYYPTLVLSPDGAETDGDQLVLALDYVDEHYQLRVSPWDLLQDRLLRTHLSAGLPALRARREAEAQWSADEMRRCAEKVERYAQKTPGSDITELLRGHIPEAIRRTYGSA